MIEVRTEELTGEALNWAVAQAAGVDVFLHNGYVFQARQGYADNPCYKWSPCKRWDQAGFLLTQFLMSLDVSEDEAGAKAVDPKTGRHCVLFADDALTAICRAVVLVMLGHTVSTTRFAG